MTSLLEPDNEDERLPALLKKAFLQAAERMDKDRKDISCKMICDTHHSMFEGRRRAVQYFWRDTKKRNIKSYAALLDSYGVKPGVTTSKLLREAEENENETKNERKEEEEEFGKDDEEEAPPPPKNENLCDAFSRVMVLSPPTKPSLANVTGTTTKMNLSSPIPTTIAASSSSVSDASANPVLTYIEALEAMKQDGSDEFPYITIVDLDRPESHRGFQVHFIPGIKHKGYNRDGFHISKVVAAPQVNEWEAFIPKKIYPSLDGRILQVRGPSQDYWHMSANRYHEDENNIKCPATYKKHRALERAIKDNPKRQLENTLFVFPRDVRLENYVFSEDGIVVRKFVNDMYSSMEVEGDDGIIEFDIEGVDVYWRIAIDGGEALEEKPKQKRLFERRTKKKVGKKRNKPPRYDSSEEEVDEPDENKSSNARSSTTRRRWY